MSMKAVVHLKESGHNKFTLLRLILGSDTCMRALGELVVCLR